jgi:hypothetical protein
MQFKLKIVSLLSAIMMVFLVSCNKETAVQPSKMTTNQSVNNLPTVSYKTIDPNGGGVDVPPVVQETITLSDLIQNATFTVDAKENVAAAVNTKKLSPKALANLKKQQTFTVETPFEISASLTASAFEKAGLAPTKQSILVQNGTYQVQNIGGRIRIDIYICIPHKAHYDCYYILSIEIP